MYYKSNYALPSKRRHFLGQVESSKPKPDQQDSAKRIILPAVIGTSAFAGYYIGKRANFGLIGRLALAGVTAIGVPAIAWIGLSIAKNKSPI